MWNLNKKKQVFLDIIIILCWMGIVFTFSSQIGKTSTNLSGSIASKLVDIVHKNEELSSKERTKLINSYNHVIRKLAHYTIYLLGGVAIISFVNSLLDHKWKAILATLLTGFIYASSDEIHQYFVSGRDARFTDVLIDTAGILTGIIIYLIVLAIGNRKRNKNKKNKEIEECI